MATITDLLRDTINVIKTIDSNSEDEISKRLATVVTLNSNAKASTIERYMTFMNEQIFSKLSTENALGDLHQLVPVLEKLVVLVSDDGLSLEQALVAAQAALQMAAVAETVVSEARQKPASLACVLSIGKRMLPAVKRLLVSLNCSGASSVAVASAVAQPASHAEAAQPASHAEAAQPASEAAPEAAPTEPLPTEQPQPTLESAPAPHSLELREAEPSPPASDNTDQKEEPSN